MKKLTDDQIAFLRKPYLAHCATVMSDGSPHVSPVWVDTDGTMVLINTAKGRVKYNNLLRNNAIAISITDEGNFYRKLLIRGHAQIIEDGADAHINFLAKKYTGADVYQGRQPGEERVILRITPEWVSE